jgi:hypothetical protein
MRLLLSLLFFGWVMGVERENMVFEHLKDKIRVKGMASHYPLALAIVFGDRI